MGLHDTEFQSKDAEQAFAAFPVLERHCLLKLREHIFDTAARTPGVGHLEETLKWKKPAYLTTESGSGSTIRLGIPKQGGFAIYTICSTTILSDFRSMFPDDFRYEGNRAIHFQAGEIIDFDKLTLLISSALTYNLP